MILSLISSSVFAQLAIPQVKPPAPKMEVQSDIDYSPVRIEQSVLAGQKIVQKMKIVNNSNEETLAQVEILKVAMTPDGTVVLPKRAKKGEKTIALPFLEKGVFTETPSFTLKPKEVKEINLNIATTKEDKGSYYFVYGVTAVPNFKTPKAKKNLSVGAVGFKLNVYSFGSITIKNTELPKIDFSTLSQFSKTTKKLNLITTVQNTGNCILKDVTTTAVLVSAKKEVLSKITLTGSSEKTNIPQKITKQYKGSFEGIASGKYQVLITVKDSNNQIIETKQEEVNF